MNSWKRMIGRKLRERVEMRNKKIQFGAMLLLGMVAALFLPMDVVGFGVPLLLGAVLVPALATGAGVNTSSGNLDKFESDIMIGDIDTANALQGLIVVIDDETTINITGTTFLNWFQKFSNRMVGAGVIGLNMRIATGRIEKKGSIVFQNNGATTPAVYWESYQPNGVPIRASMQGLNANTRYTFSGDKFAGLAVNVVAGLTFDVTLTNGIKNAGLIAAEVDAMFSRSSDTQTDGRLDAALTGFDNRRGNIASVDVIVGATSTTVMLVK